MWLETLGLGLTRPESIEMLRGRGLRGVRWLHLPEGAHIYRSLLRGRPMSRRLAQRTAAALEQSGVPVEHVFLLSAGDLLDRLTRRVLGLVTLGAPSPIERGPG